MGIRADIYLKERPTHPWYPTVEKRMKGNYELRGKYMANEDDMSFMEDVFLKRQLPFAEYLVESDYHALTLGEKVSGALHDMKQKYGMHFSAKYKIPCKGGAVFEVSVISGKMFYCRADAPYEVMGPDIDDDVLAYQTDEDLMVYLAKLIARAKEY